MSASETLNEISSSASYFHTSPKLTLTAGHNKQNLLSFFRLFFLSVVFHEAHRSCGTCLDVLADLRNRKPEILTLLNYPSASWQDLTCARNTKNPLNSSIMCERERKTFKPAQIQRGKPNMDPFQNKGSANDYSAILTSWQSIISEKMTNISLVISAITCW